MNVVFTITSVHTNFITYELFSIAGRSKFFSISAVQRKIFRLILSNFCCWAPISVMVVLNLAGVKLPPVSYTITAIILLPLNSALNPILYSNFVDKFLQCLIPKYGKRNLDESFSSTVGQRSQRSLKSRKMSGEGAQERNRHWFQSEQKISRLLAKFAAYFKNDALVLSCCVHHVLSWVSFLKLFLVDGHQCRAEGIGQTGRRPRASKAGASKEWIHKKYILLKCCN